jgi:hypothetical protein
MNDRLEEVRAWAKDKIASGEEPPWAWYQYMKLIETVDAILGSMKHATTGSSLQSPEHPDAHLRLVAATDSPDSARPHHVGLPVHLPM